MARKPRVSRPSASKSARPAGLLQIMRPDGSVDAALDPDMEVEALVGMYHSMLRIRVLDERMLALQRQGRIGFYGSCTGQEAAVVGSAAALEAEDWIFPALREGGAMLHRGYPLRRYLAQIFGSAEDHAQGRQMPSHMSGREVNQISWSSCIGSQLPQAAGAAWAVRLRRDPTVVLAYLGDGATSSADFHYALNFAAVYRVPLVVFCQNNGWSISLPTSEQTASKTIAIKADGYGMPGLRVDGNDLMAVHAATISAVRRARAGDGPTLIEAVTYRMGAHSSSDDPTRYRDEAEVSMWRERDPLVRLERYLDGRALFDAAAQADLRQTFDEEIRAAVAEAERSPPPDWTTLFDDVQAEPLWHLEEQRAGHESGAVGGD